MFVDGNVICHCLFVSACAQKKRVQGLINTLDLVINAELRRQPQKGLDTMLLLQVELSKKQVQAMISS
jgi:hypothetical protein